MSGPAPVAIASGSFWAIESQGCTVMLTWTFLWVALNILISAT